MLKFEITRFSNHGLHSVWRHCYAAQTEKEGIGRRSLNWLQLKKCSSVKSLVRCKSIHAITSTCLFCSVMFWLSLQMKYSHRQTGDYSTSF